MLETAVYNYVYDFLTDMKAAGVDNIITVKNGNEQNGGLLFPVASGISQNHAAIITASSRAVRQVYPGAINTIHTNTGTTPNSWKVSSVACWGMAPNLMAWGSPVWRAGYFGPADNDESRACRRYAGRL